MRAEKSISMAVTFAAVVCCVLGMSAGGDVIVDNGDSGTSYSGTWEVSGGTQPYGKDSVWARDGAKYRWAFGGQSAGTYEVLMWWSGWSSRARVVDVSIAHAGGSSAVVVDQQGGAGQWNSLGTFYFDGSGSVTVTAAYGATVSTCADAVWFRRYSGDSKPLAYIKWINPETASVGQMIAFSGYGEDLEGDIEAYYWFSSIDGLLSTAPSFSTSKLSAGTHEITFAVVDEAGQYSTATRTVTVSGGAASTIIIDNGDSGTSSTGTWLPSGASGYYGSNSLYSRDGATYTWSFSPPATSVYTLSMWWTEWSSRTNSAKVTIGHAGGTATAYVNQQKSGGQWNKIGEYSFTAGKQYAVTITGSWGSASTCADAVRFVKGSQGGGDDGGGSSGGNPPKVDFYAERFRGGAPLSVQFRDKSTGDMSQWRWDFGDGETSSSRNPSHTYNKAGLHTVRLTVTGAGGTGRRTRYDYVDIKPTTTETIYLVDGFSGNNYFLTDTAAMMRGFGATAITDGWRYKPSNSNMTYYLRWVRNVAAAENALKEKDAHVVLVGHANFGFGMTFVNSWELASQRIDDIRYVDDDRFVKYSTDFVAATPENVQYEAAYPNWKPVLKNGSSALMPYDFGDPRGNPPYNFYLTYKIPGDSTLYRIERANGSYVQRFPGLGVPAWYSASGAAPDASRNREYFIRNTDTYYNRFELNGEWPVRDAGSGYVGHNYQVQWAGSGSKAAKWTVVVKKAGQYQVLATWPAMSNNATNARYTIKHANGSSVVYGNHASGSGRHSLGWFTFNAGPATVELSDKANGQLIADAIILKNSSGEIFTDNTFRYKPHIKTSSTSGRVICYTGSGKIKSEDVKYARLFHSSCKSMEYFAGILNRGIVYAKSENVLVEHDTAVPYLDYYLRGYTDQDILKHVNSYENIHEFFNFNEKPPSMR